MAAGTMAVRRTAVTGARLQRLTNKIYVDLGVIRIMSAAMLVLAALLPHIPGYPGLVCPLRATTGIPCPLCGMTTSVTAAVRGRVVESLAANPAGLPAVVAAVVIVAVRPKRAAVPIYVIPVVLGAMWLFELVRFDIIL